MFLPLTSNEILLSFDLDHGAEMSTSQLPWLTRPRPFICTPWLDKIPSSLAFFMFRAELIGISGSMLRILACSI